MDWRTGQLCRAAARYYATRAPLNADVAAMRALWERARILSKLPEATPLSEAEQAIAFTPPAGELVVPHAGGLLISISGELFGPVEKHVEAVRSARGPISLRVNCAGGCLTSAFSLHDALIAAGPERVEALVAGACGSAATIILAAADHRRALRGSRFLLHGPSTVAWGKADDLQQAAEQLNALLPRMSAAYQRICGPTLVNQWLSGADYFLSAEEAAAVNLCTEVVEPVPMP